MKRSISFTQAKRDYPNRYTMEHKPAWANMPCGNGKYYAPQYRTDREWYENTAFPGENGIEPDETACYTIVQTWPLGQWLDAPFEVQP